MSDFYEMAEALEQSRNMPDPADQATGLEMADRACGVAAVRSLIQGPGADDCEDCGEDIPKARRLAAPWAVCCVECQQLREVSRG